MERDDNFDPLRIFAAGLVLFSHSYPLFAGPTSRSPRSPAVPRTPAASRWRSSSS
jgi:hypothetical protein